MMIGTRWVLYGTRRSLVVSFFSLPSALFGPPRGSVDSLPIQGTVVVCVPSSKLSDTLWNTAVGTVLLLALGTASLYCTRLDI